MGLNAGTAADVIQTKLDKVFNQEFNGEQHPGHATAETGQVFKQDTASNRKVIMEIFKGVGAWDSAVGEEDNFPEGTAAVGNEKTFSVGKFAKSLPIPRDYFDDDEHSTVNMAVRNFGRRGRTTRDNNAMGLWRGSFATYTTADGAYICSNTHTNQAGSTIDNLETSALSPATLKTSIAKLYQQKAQDDVIDGHLASVLLVAPANYDYACEITKSELKADTAENNMNPYSSIYNLWVFTSPYLGDTPGGDDDDWWLMSSTHAMTRFIRRPIDTYLRDYKETDNETYKYRGSFREVVGCPTYEGIIGHNVA